ncbi:hypothetical protein FIV42_00655 [Persicimonas caeni]|uniref:Uncharacterized protein n=1 Tax=Persicimonas caeni TaxID=2292766 RepID=A0A4Y6PLU1_PERCE|nr:hypothetical protein [Persicimonas caeni]QDG49294.1 hypothetical protein FIV42_00655 [Persicimonas caeni]QED30515.1 hypothetical protein FRD00_00650 [Persicimonas caeni]
MALNTQNTAFQSVALGLQIEGVPYLDDYKPFGALFTWGIPDSDLVPSYGVEAQPLSEEMIPDNIDGSADFWEGGLGLQAGTFRLVASEAVTKRLCASPRAEGYVTADVTSSTQTITVTSSRIPEAGEYLYIGDETVYVRAVSSAGIEHECTVWRDVAESPGQSHLAGDKVYWRPPYYKHRRLWLYLFDNLRGTKERVWHGFLDSIRSNDQQTLIEIGGSDALVTLYGAEGGTDHPWDTTDLHYAKNGELSGSLSYSGSEPDWATSSSSKVFQVGDQLYRFRQEGGSLTPLVPLDLTTHDEEEGTPVRDKTVREVLCLLREQDNGQPADTFVQNVFSAIYGPEGHAAAIALALMLSNGGTSDNNPVVDGQYLVFDVFGQSWGMGIPVDMIDAESWKRCIDTVPAPVDRLVLNWDERFSLEDVILNQLLIPYGFRPVPTEAGKLALRHLETWTHSTIEELTNDDGTGSFAYLLPERIETDWRVNEVNAQVRAKLGGTPYGAEPDAVTSTQLVGNRTDYQGNQSPFKFDMSLRFKSRRDEVQIWLDEQSKKRRETPPVLQCVLPLHTRDSYRSLGERGRVPQLLQWVAVSTDNLAGDSPELIGPDGSRVSPRDTDITFIGLVIARTLRFKDQRVDVDVLLVNWSMNDHPSMLIAPADRVISYSTSTDEMVLAGDYETVSGDTGFTAGDEIVLVEESGRHSFKDPGSLTVSAVNNSTKTLTVSGIGYTIGSTERLYVRLADYDDYSNPAVGNAYYNHGKAAERRTAFISDEAGTLGSALDEGDKYA